MSLLPSIPFDAMFSLLSEDPATRMLQGGVILGSAVSVYLLFFATRDVLLRSSSLLVQLLCIVLVAALPIVGFFLYLLLRPASTLRVREMERLLRELVQREKARAASQAVGKAIRRVPRRLEASVS